jgi:DNA-binding transcriptional regulator YiaG
MKKSRTKNKSSRKPSRAAIELGKAIVADMTEFAEALEAGIPLESKYTVRRVQLPEAPNKYTSQAVRVTRDRICVSQAVFAHLLGVSTILVQAWEQGNRVPAAWARRLLDEVNRDPQRWRGIIRKAS